MRPAPAEFALTVDCCRWAFSRGGELEISRHVDWGGFLRLARFHRVQGLVSDCLRSIDAKLPTEVMDALAPDTEAIVAANLRIAAECGELRADFEKAGVPLLFFKGLTVGALAYPKPLLKMGWDIDLLVGPDRLADAIALLRGRGYRQVVPAQSKDALAWHSRRKESVWTRDSSLHVELHTRLADNVHLIPGITVDSPRQLVEIMPGTAMPTLAADELFAYLCVHGASSLWFRLKWITDLAALLHRAGTDEIERLYLCSQKLGAGRAPGQALLLADRLYGTLTHGGLAQRLAQDRAVLRLTDMALNQLIRSHEPTEMRLGTAQIHLSQLLLLPGVGFKVGEIARQARDALGDAAGRAAART